MNEEIRNNMIQLWFSILSNRKYEARNIVFLTFFSVIFPAFIYLYGNTLYENTNLMNSNKLIGFLNFVLGIHCIIPLLISIYDYHYLSNIISITLIKTHIIAQILSIPIYSYGYYLNSNKNYNKKTHFIIIIILSIIYLIIFFIYLFYFSEYISYPI